MIRPIIDVQVVSRVWLVNMISLMAVCGMDIQASPSSAAQNNQPHTWSFDDDTTGRHTRSDIPQQPHKSQPLLVDPVSIDKFSPDDIKSITYIIDIITAMNIYGIPTINDLLIFTRRKGFTPRVTKEGHPRSGQRQVVRIQEAGEDYFIKEFYSAYLINPQGILFDRFYYGLEYSPLLMRYLIQRLHNTLDYLAVSYVHNATHYRWNLPDGSFVFLRVYKRHVNSEHILLIGKEWEIHFAHDETP